MEILTIDQTNEVSGGWIPLITALVTVFVLPKVINDHRKEYNEWGQNLGEATFEYLHPYDPNHPVGIYK